MQSEIDAAYEALENAVSGLKKVDTDNKKDDDKKDNDNYLHNPTLNKREIFHSGIEIGKDMIGTMTNTLILAFAGSAFITLLVFISYQVQFNQLINSNYLCIEIAQGICGTFGIVLTIPAASAIMAGLLTRKH